MASSTPVPVASFKLQSVSYAGSTITLHFDRAVSAGNGNFVISDGYAQSYMGVNGLSTRIVGATDVHKLDDSDPQISYNGQDVVITLTSPLKAGVNYSVTMDSGAVIDSNNGANYAISSPKLFPFTASGTVSAPPATPTAVVASAIHFTDTGDSGDYITAARDQQLSGSYTGTLGANDFIQVSLDNGASWHKATAGADNSWSYNGAIDTTNMLHGDAGAFNGTLLARVSNLAGGSSATAAQAYIFSTQPIEIGISSVFSLSSDTGSSNSDRVTKTAAQTISGTYNGQLFSGQKLQVSMDGGSSWIDATAANQAWHANVTLLSGTHGVLVRATDGAGNTSSSAESNYTLLTSTVSLAGKGLSLAAGSDGGVYSDDHVTSNVQAVTLDVKGLHGFRVGDTIQIIDTSNGSAVVGSYVIQSADLYNGSDYLNPGGNALPSLDINLNGLIDGTHSLAARVVDLAGNVSAVNSDSVQVVVDSITPTLESKTPLEGVALDASAAVLTFTFDEDISLGDDVTITVTDDYNSNNSVSLSFDNIEIIGKMLTIHLPLLTSGTHYSMAGLVIRDLAGNSLDFPALHFTTSGTYSGPAPQTPLPYISDTAPESADANSVLHSDGITKSNRVNVEGLSSGEWYYRLSPGDSWHQGSDSHFTLADGTYLANQIEVKQTVNGVDSAIATINHDITVDTQAFNISTLSGAHFRDSDTSLTGTLTASITDQIVEITLDHGASWQQAILNPTTAAWSLSGLDLSSAGEYGVRLADKAGNVSGTVYYLPSSDNGYYHPDYDDIVVYGGGGVDYITVGDRAWVNSGNGASEVITTGDDAYIIADRDSTIITGNGNNFISTSFGANITTGNGDDTIYCSTLDGVKIRAGLGNDKLTSNTIVNGLTLGGANLDVQGIEELHFGYSGANVLTINTGASVRTFSDAGKLTITADFSGSTIHLGAEWAAGAAQGNYMAYHSSGGEILLIGSNISVDIAAGSI